MRPINDNILVKPLPPEQFVGGLKLPEEAKDSHARGEVIAIGSGTDEYPMECVVGDIILYHKTGGVEVQHEGETMRVIGCNHVRVILD